MPTVDPSTVSRSSSWPGPRDEVPALLAAAADLLGPSAPAPRGRPVPDEPSRCLAALEDAHRALVRELADPALTDLDRERIGALLLRIGQASAAVRQAGADRRATLPALAGLMNRFRAATSVAALLEGAPREIVDLGYDRCLVSRVHEGRWIAQSSYVRDDTELAAAITLAGSEAPATLDRRLVESDLVRRRTPMLVPDARRNPRVHRRLIDVTASPAYVAAPIQVGGAVVGLIHVDRIRRSEVVGETDVEVLGLVAECLGWALERAGGRSTTPLGERRAGLEKLTARELEVLDRIATGEGNVDIALALFITEATVKAHVKHIFRKLGVTHRAEAVSVYLRR